MHDHVFHTIEFHSITNFPVLRVIQFFLCDIPIFLPSYIFHLTRYHISFKVITENINETTQETNHRGTAVAASRYLSSFLLFTPIVTPPLVPSPLYNSQTNPFFLLFLTNNSCVVSD